MVLSLQIIPDGDQETICGAGDGNLTWVRNMQMLHPLISLQILTFLYYNAYLKIEYSVRHIYIHNMHGSIFCQQSVKFPEFRNEKHYPSLFYYGTKVQ